MTHPRNLCPTVENRPIFQTLPCSVTRRMKYPPFFVFNKDDPDYMNPEFLNTNYHEWPDHCGGTTGCACIHCGKTRKEVRVRINPKTNKPVRGSIAYQIAHTAADVPPLRFLGENNE